MLKHFRKNIEKVQSKKKILDIDDQALSLLALFWCHFFKEIFDTYEVQ